MTEATSPNTASDAMIVICAGVNDAGAGAGAGVGAPGHFFASFGHDLQSHAGLDEFGACPACGRLHCPECGHAVVFADP